MEPLVFVLLLLLLLLLLLAPSVRPSVRPAFLSFFLLLRTTILLPRRSLPSFLAVCPLAEAANNHRRTDVLCPTSLT
jgi:hypothetical protein